MAGEVRHGLDLVPVELFAAHRAGRLDAPGLNSERDAPQYPDTVSGVAELQEIIAGLERKVVDLKAQRAARQPPLAGAFLWAKSSRTCEALCSTFLKRVGSEAQACRFASRRTVFGARRRKRPTVRCRGRTGV